MTTYFFCTSLWIFIYLVCQSISDIKTKQVYVIWNYIALLTIFVQYLFQCIQYHQLPNYLGILGGIGFLFLHHFFLQGVFGTGDAKALVVFYFQSGLLFPQSNTFVLAFPIAIYLLASLIYIPFLLIRGILQKQSMRTILFGKSRCAFFPFLTIAYSLIIGFSFFVAK